MSRAQVVIDTKFQNAFFRELKSQKWVEVFPPAKLCTTSFRTTIFSVRTWIKLEFVFSFSSKSIVSMAQEKQNAEGTIKKCVFFNGANFLKAAKFYKNNIFKRN